MSPTPPQPELFPETGPPETPPVDIAEVAAHIRDHAPAPDEGETPAERRAREIAERRGEDLAAEQTGRPSVLAEPDEDESTDQTPRLIAEARANLAAVSPDAQDIPARSKLTPDLVGTYWRSRNGEE